MWKKMWGIFGVILKKILSFRKTLEKFWGEFRKVLRNFDRKIFQKLGKNVRIIISQISLKFSYLIYTFYFTISPKSKFFQKLFQRFFDFFEKVFIIFFNVFATPPEMLLFFGLVLFLCSSLSTLMGHFYNYNITSVLTQLGMGSIRQLRSGKL